MVDDKSYQHNIVGNVVFGWEGFVHWEKLSLLSKTQSRVCIISKEEDFY
jgi:hypothetical protein